MAEKVYYPETIDDNPLPTSSVVGYDPQLEVGKSGGSYSPPSIKEAGYPDPRISFEVIGSALNTKSKKILQNFGFTQSGSIQIGEYLSGSNGDIRITSEGLTARNSSGNTTFALDGDSGDATFAGTVQAGTLISGKVVVGNNTWIIDGDSEEPKILLYVNNIPSIILGIAS